MIKIIEIEKVYVSSSWIESYGYDIENKLLIIKTNADVIYGYKNVSKFLFDTFESEESVGKGYHNYIKSNNDLRYFKQDLNNQIIDMEESFVVLIEEVLSTIKANLIKDISSTFKSKPVILGCFIDRINAIKNINDVKCLKDEITDLIRENY